MGVFCFRDFLLSAFFAVIICADKVSYRDVHVFRIDAKNQKELDKVKVRCIVVVVVVVVVEN